MSRDGSKAKAQPQHASRKPSAIQARACLRDLSHAAMHIIIIPPRRDPEARRNLSQREQCANCRPTAGLYRLRKTLSRKSTASQLAEKVPLRGEWSLSG